MTWNDAAARSKQLLETKNPLPIKGSLSAVDEAVANYLRALESFDAGRDSYTGAIEIPKLGIADAFLEALGLPRAPKNEVGQRVKKKVKAYIVGFVYVVQNKRNGLFKIGFSTKPKVREKTLQSEEPEVEMINKWPGTRCDELIVHSWFADQRVRGEWFRITHDDIERIRLALESKKEAA